MKRKSMKTKIKKTSLQNIVSPSCGCHNPIADIINCGCRGQAIDPILGALGALDIAIPGFRGPIAEAPIGTLTPLPIAYPGCRGPVIEPALGPIAPFEIGIAGYKPPVIDIPNYRYADLMELSPLGCLFPSIEIPSYGVLPAPMSLPTVEYFNAVDLPCGCPGPQCGCRAPAVKLPCAREYTTPMELLSYGNMASVIEIPSYAPGALIQIDGCRAPVVPACGCAGPCSCPGVPLSPCGCKTPCSCPEYQVLSCGCQGSCSCPTSFSPCGCKGPCGCGGAPVPCGCQGPCSCPAIQSPVGLLPAVEVPSYGCGCGLSGCDCVKYLRQVTLQPPFL
ncbi:unnamed protein product [Arctia plantaginis]|uniref:Uncharacterized protein n=1 Tax=Arctia plantaginis TaxID=874455 RepID=A0A8S1A5L3_ARCPL|nr:unnamed protein product [Arctia plantaginis]